MGITFFRRKCHFKAKLLRNYLWLVQKKGVTKLQSITEEHTYLFCEEHVNGIQFLTKLSSPILLLVSCEMNAWEQMKHLSSIGIPPGRSTTLPPALAGSTCLICNWTLQFYNIFKEPGIFHFFSSHSDQLLSKHSTGEYWDTYRGCQIT